MEKCIHINLENTKDLRDKIDIILKKFHSNLYNQNVNHKCFSCESSFYLHVCLTCNYIGCSKNFHYREHFQKHGHCFSFLIQKQIIYCFICNKFINNEIYKNLNNYKYIPTTEINTYITDKNIAVKINDSIDNLNLCDTENYLISNISDKVYKKYPCIILKGSANLGNTCYLNSLIFMFLYNEHIKNYFFGLKHIQKNCKISFCLICGFKSVYNELYSKTNSLVLNNLLFTLCKRDSYFLGSNQQDVHELFLRICNILHEDDQKVNIQDNVNKEKITDLNCECFIHNIFSGINVLKYFCKNCGSHFIKQEPFYNLSLQIKDNVQTMLDKFYENETIVDISCGVCKTNCEFLKESTIEKFPKVLCLQIKRFELKNNKITKIDTKVENNDNIMIFNKNYSLKGVIIHQGNLNDGHYISYGFIDDDCICFNDEIIKKVKVKEMYSNQSYLLFYHLNH